MIILQIDGGGLIFSVLTILSFLVGLFYWANNRAINQMKDEMQYLREQIRALLVERGAGTRIITADEIEHALKSYRISPTAAFITVDRETEKVIEKRIEPPPHLRGVHLEQYIPPFDAGAGSIQFHPPIWEQNQSESGKEFARRQPPPVPQNKKPPSENYGSGLFDDDAEQSFYDKRDAREQERQAEIEARENQEKEFAKGNRQPITEVLSEIYDEESDGKSNN